jgi:hypothetical protein
MSTLTFGQLANVHTLGIGLYLALVVVQAMSATGITALRRRVTALQSSVNSGKLSGEMTNMHKLLGEVHRLEIKFHKFNATLLWVATGFFMVALVYFIYATVVQASKAPVSAVVFSFGFYLILPVLIFLGSTWVISNRCAAVSSDVGDAEKRVLKALLG